MDDTLVIKTDSDSPAKLGKPDMCTCATCGWKGLVSDCDTEQDGDWETGYYDSSLCPVCDDGGCIDDYWYSNNDDNIED